MKNVYKIRPAIKIPMALAMTLSIPVFMDITSRALDPMILTLAILLIIYFYTLTLNSLIKMVTVAEDTIRIRSISGYKVIPVSDITMSDAITFQKRQFVTISTKKHNHLLRNNLVNFKDLIEDLCRILPAEKQGENLSAIKNNIKSRPGDIIITWMIVALLILILYIKSRV